MITSSGPVARGVSKKFRKIFFSVSRMENPEKTDIPIRVLSMKEHGAPPTPLRKEQGLEKLFADCSFFGVGRIAQRHLFFS